jgi:hypothetical protein
MPSSTHANCGISGVVESPEGSRQRHSKKVMISSQNEYYDWRFSASKSRILIMMWFWLCAGFCAPIFIVFRIVIVMPSSLTFSVHSDLSLLPNIVVCTLISRSRPEDTAQGRT